jgi:hypothetical protein
MTNENVCCCFPILTSTELQFMFLREPWPLPQGDHIQDRLAAAQESRVSHISGRLEVDLGYAIPRQERTGENHP